MEAVITCRLLHKSQGHADEQEANEEADHSRANRAGILSRQQRHRTSGHSPAAWSSPLIACFCILGPGTPGHMHTSIMTPFGIISSVFSNNCRNTDKTCLIYTCHPCARAMLIFSVSCQF